MVLGAAVLALSPPTHDRQETLDVFRSILFSPETESLRRSFQLKVFPNFPRRIIKLYLVPLTSIGISANNYYEQ